MMAASLVPPMDFRLVFVDPWTTDFGLKGWIVLMGFLTSVACGWVGQHLLLRRMALMGDAISHSILPGLASAFLIVSFFFGDRGTPGHAARDSGVMLVGAVAAGWVTTVLIGLVHRHSRVKQDAAIGIVFATLFAVGVVLITLFADHVDLDADCVLYGEIGFVPFAEPVRWLGVNLGPLPVVRMGVLATLTVGFGLLFYKELLISAFDASLATSLGINARAVHLLLMGWLSIVVVGAFESVGAILVIAMLLVPGATASLLTTRLPRIHALILLHGAVSSVAGLHLALWLDCSIAGAMVVAGCTLFAAAWVYSVVRRALDSRVAGERSRAPAPPESGPPFSLTPPPPA
ncbi:MAG: metal ABC transporter permease [Verrucomicrobiales bacterium]|nr:metal ABC transporter permease [Verrucomicrobiales bacterium]